MVYLLLQAQHEQLNWNNTDANLSTIADQQQT